jgi:hypothetical protein
MDTECNTTTLSTVDVSSLIERLTAKDAKPSALLDAEIALAIGYYDYKFHCAIELQLKSDIDAKHRAHESRRTVQVKVSNTKGGGSLYTEDLPRFTASLDAARSVLSPVIALGPSWAPYYTDPRASKWTWSINQSETTQRWQVTAGVRLGGLWDGNAREQASADTEAMALMAAILKLREHLKICRPDLLVPYDPDAEITPTA